MGMQPKRQPREGGDNDFLYPAPLKDGLQQAAVSLIVDMGIQDRDNFVEVYNEKSDDHIKALAERGAELVVPEYGDDKGKDCISIPQKPKQAVAVFVDLLGGVVDYGGSIGEAQYRHMLNRDFKNDVSGIPFGAVKPAKNGGVWTFGALNILSKLAKATGQTQILEDGDKNMDVSDLLGKPFLINITTILTVKGEKTYTNVKHGEPQPLMEGIDVLALDVTPLLIQMDDATKDNVKFIRKAVRDKIMLAHDFSGSQMETAFVEAGYCTVQVAEPAAIPDAEQSASKKAF